MFDTGFWEFALIAVIILVVVGPEKMPALAKTAGKYVGKLRNFVANVKADTSKEFGDIGDEFSPENLKKQLGLQDDNSVDNDSILDIVDEVKKTGQDIKKDIQRTTQPLKENKNE
jgi:sec-independent protein translocase protein TatB